ncbi:tRNA pseudouridine(13) synthase TruD [Candidatus Woesearchaeota archaeon]|nr:tRNA pseudouridine(13) synthase TruD [Candidatus Woesearchaeota archaeon]
MYQIKVLPEDFVVEEISTVKPKKQGKYAYCSLTKINYSTPAAAERIAKALKIPVSKIGFAGNKDKKAVTHQKISMYGISSERIATIKLGDISLQFLGYGNEPISLGDLEGNSFTITVRNIEDKPRAITRFPNYFDEQRFSKNNHVIGKLLIQRKFLQAAEIIEHASVQHALAREPKNPIAAIKTLPRKVLMLYINAYQSWLWNETVKQYLVQFPHRELPWKFGVLLFPTVPITNISITFIGFHIPKTDKTIQNILDEIMEEENITPRSFVLKELPGMSAEGGMRDLLATAKNLEMGKAEEDEFNAGKKKIQLKFFLQKGSYATMYVKALFS